MKSEILFYGAMALLSALLVVMGAIMAYHATIWQLLLLGGFMVVVGGFAAYQAGRGVWQSLPRPPVEIPPGGSRQAFRQVAAPRPIAIERWWRWLGRLSVAVAMALALWATESEGWLVWLLGILATVFGVSGVATIATANSPETDRGMR